MKNFCQNQRPLSSLNWKPNATITVVLHRFQFRKKKNINEKKNNNIESWMSWKITNENVASTFSLKQLNKSKSNFGKWFISINGKQTKSHCLKNTNCWVAAALLQMTIQIIKFLQQLVTITNVSQTQSISKVFNVCSETSYWYCSWHNCPQKKTLKK